jgi:hypothetical protein
MAYINPSLQCVGFHGGPARERRNIVYCSSHVRLVRWHKVFRDSLKTRNIHTTDMKISNRIDLFPSGHLTSSHQPDVSGMMSYFSFSAIAWMSAEPYWMMRAEVWDKRQIQGGLGFVGLCRLGDRAHPSSHPSPRPPRKLESSVFSLYHTKCHEDHYHLICSKNWIIWPQSY